MGRDRNMTCLANASRWSSTGLFYYHCKIVLDVFFFATCTQMQGKTILQNGGLNVSESEGSWHQVVD